MLSSRSPIATFKAGTEIANAVAHCGLVVGPKDGDALAGAIGKLVCYDKALFYFCKQTRLCAEENLARDSVLGRLLEHL